MLYDCVVWCWYLKTVVARHSLTLVMDGTMLGPRPSRMTGPTHVVDWVRLTSVSRVGRGHVGAGEQAAAAAPGTQGRTDEKRRRDPPATTPSLDSLHAPGPPNVAGWLLSHPLTCTSKLPSGAQHALVMNLPRECHYLLRSPTRINAFRKRNEPK